MDNLRNKTLSFIILTLLIFTLAACGGENDNTDENGDIPTELTTDLTDALSLDVDYNNKTFMAHGIEAVTLVSCEDGDTAEFKAQDGVHRVRFLGIDTPEASHFYEPWGVQATDFACERLADAETIVIEWDEEMGRFDNYSRTLAYIWYDGRLLNLELIEQAYSTAAGAGQLKYGDIMQEANNNAQATNLRIWGEEDPMFKYLSRGDGVELTIEELVTNPDDYLLGRVTVSGVITRILGDQAYMQDGDYGIFIYAGHGRSNPDRLAVGNEITIEDAQVYRDVRRYGGVFLTDVNAQNIPSKIGTIHVHNQNVEVEAETVTYSDFSPIISGTLIRLEALTITDFDTQPSSRENARDTEIIYAVDTEGNEIIIEQSYRVYGSLRYDVEQLSIGQTINVIGPLRETEEGFKVLLTDANDLEIISE